MLNPERKDCLTATDMTILMGAVPVEWGTPHDVWRKKMGIEPPFRSNVAMKLGEVLERPLFDLAMPLIPAFLKDWQPWLRSDFYPLGATADAIIVDENGKIMGAEVKTTSEDWGDEIPTRVKIQAHVGMISHGNIGTWKGIFLGMDKDLKESILLNLLNNQHPFLGLQINPKIVDINYNEELASKIIGMATFFWSKYVLPKVAPDDFKAVPIPNLDPTIYTCRDQEVLDLMRQRYRLVNMSDQIDADLALVNERIKAKFPSTFAKMNVDGCGFGMSRYYRGGGPKTHYEKAFNALAHEVNPELAELIRSRFTEPTPKTKVEIFTGFKKEES